MTLFSSCLKILVVCELCSSEPGVLYANRTVFVGENDTVELNCHRLQNFECGWHISNQAIQSSMESNSTYKTYIQYNEGRLVDPKLKHPNIDIFGGNNTFECKLKIRNFSAVDEGSYTCKAWTIPTDKYYTNYNVHLKSSPSNLTINGVIMENERKLVRGVEGTKLTIVCTVESKRPAATLILSITELSVWRVGKDRITYSFIPTKKENMQSIVCSTNSEALAYQLSLEVQLDIQYSPVVKITSRPTKHKLVLICNPNGNPENYTFGDWEHWSEFKEHIRNIKGAPNGTLTFLKFKNNKGLHELDGIYKCKASNGINGTNGHLYQKGTALVHNKVPPIFVDANKPIQFGRYGQKMNLTVLLYNKYGKIQTTISKLNEPLHTKSRHEKIRTRDIFHDSNVTVSGIKITFQLILDEMEDFTDYTIKACNGIGCNELTVKITTSRISNIEYDVKAILLILLVDIAVVLVKAVWEVVLIVLAVVIAITVLTVSFWLRRKAHTASDIYTPSEEVRENFQMEPVDNQFYLSFDDPDLAHAQNVHNQSVQNTRLTSTAPDNQTNQIQLHNDNGANGGRSCTYINSGVVSSVHNRQVPCQIHELNYLDITFNEAPTMRGAFIHGNVDRTIYSEIDLMADHVEPLSSSESESNVSDEVDILFMNM